MRYAWQKKDPLRNDNFSAENSSLAQLAGEIFMKSPQQYIKQKSNVFFNFNYQNFSKLNDAEASSL